jgi:hypothetical protein
MPIRTLDSSSKSNELIFTCSEVYHANAIPNRAKEVAHQITIEICLAPSIMLLFMSSLIGSPIPRAFLSH